MAKTVVMKGTDKLEEMLRTKPEINLHLRFSDVTKNWIARIDGYHVCYEWSDPNLMKSVSKCLGSYAMRNQDVWEKEEEKEEEENTRRVV